MLRLSLNTPQTLGAQLVNPNRSNWGWGGPGRVLGEIKGTKKALLGLFWGTSCDVFPGSTLKDFFQGNRARISPKGPQKVSSPQESCPEMPPWRG